MDTYTATVRQTITRYTTVEFPEKDVDRWGPELAAFEIAAALPDSAWDVEDVDEEIVGWG